MKKAIKYLLQHSELIVWVSGLVLLYYMPETGGTSLCPSVWLGFGNCPGCGIGHAIRNTLHGHISTGFGQHFMGPFAVIIILHRIIQLTKPFYLSHHETQSR
ncbi:MAG: DUF2752 domain-containing protein [Chitinophagaceae bacterium]|nr:DUF2752 domain-containing protein [Chitinophagaceae bacterium]